jgi:twinkle protein
LEKTLYDGECQRIGSRKLDEATCRRYHYRSGPGWQAADYFDVAGHRVAQHCRYPGKGFSWRGDARKVTLWGQHLFKPNRRVIVTEGEIDCMSVAQAFGLRWPVVSLPNGAAAARKDFLASLEWLEGFKEVVILFDEDEAGRMAATACSEVLTPGKAFIARLPRKDANEMLQHGEVRQLLDACWQASPYRPDTIISGVDLIERVLKPPPPSIPYPWAGLDAYLRGQRCGEITCWAGGTGAGKSQLVREIAYHLHQKGEKVGIIALEESVVKAALSQISLEMGEKLHDPTVRGGIDNNAIRGAALTALNNVWFYDHFGSVEADVLLPKIKFMVLGLGVKWVILDHVSIMVSGMATEGDERKRLDELMTRLRTTVQECDFGMHLVSHLRKASGTPHEEGGRITLDDLRGSGALKQISDNIIAAERNQQDANETERNVTTLRVIKCREFGDTGISAKVKYSKTTGRITEHGFDPASGGDSDGTKGDF